jgi:hypothetical protein
VTEVLIFLLIFFGCITLIGHGMWLLLAWIFRNLLGNQKADAPRCPQCNGPLHTTDQVCPMLQRSSTSVREESLKELATAARQAIRLHKEGKLPDSALDEMLSAISDERARLTGQPIIETSRQRTPQVFPPVTKPAQSAITPQPELDTPRKPAMDQLAAEEVQADLSIPVSFTDTGPNGAEAPARPDVPTAFEPGYSWAEGEGEPERRPRSKPTPPPRVEPRRPFSEVVAAFMEQSNIRWGEIIGGLLIIGCSTALVVSLWNQISEIPVLKFLIFTTVTAALFAVGLYTEHHWKLPTTSRGILTIATLLVPLNFLAIAAVSGGALPTGPVVVAGELVSPILFFWCVLFAGRVITPSWPRLLVGGVLISSIGQLLVRHFVDPASGPLELLLIGLLPVVTYAASMAWVIHRADMDSVVTEAEANAIFVTLGASTFSTVLPLGLLLYKTGQVPQTTMQIAPLFGIAALPLLGTGMFLWKRLTESDLAVARTAGTAIAILGAAVSITSIALAWPNPASVVTSSLICFATFSLIAELFSVRPAHFVAALSLSIAYIVGFHATAGHIAWQLPREASLGGLILSPSTGQSLPVLFLILVLGSEWLARREGNWQWAPGRPADQVPASSKQHGPWTGNSAGQLYYLLVATLVAALSLALVSRFGFGLPGDPYAVTLVTAVYCAGAFWVAWRLRQQGISWVASGLLFVALAQFLGALIGFRLPWQAAALLHATLCAVAVNFIHARQGKDEVVLAKPLYTTALITSVAAVFLMVQSSPWQPSAMLSVRIFWLAGVWLLLLWIRPSRTLFNLFQAALAAGVAIGVKASLLNFEWYAFYRNSTLNPWSIQIYGSALAFLCLFWTAIRFYVGSTGEPALRSENQQVPSEFDSGSGRYQGSFSQLITSGQLAFDHLLGLCLMGGFTLFCLYVALPGVRSELAVKGTIPVSVDLGGFSHSNAFSPGSWILLALLVLLALTTLKQRRNTGYVVAVLVALYCTVPLAAGYFEGYNSTASAWRWLAVLFLVLISTGFWFRDRIAGIVSVFLDEGDHPEFAKALRATLLTLTLGPIVLFTVFAILRATAYLPPNGPSGGLFGAMGEVFSYAAPVALVGLVLAGYAWREASARFAFAAALFFNFAVTVAHVMVVMSRGGSMNRVILVEALQYNAITAAACALVWISTRKSWITSGQLPREIPLLRILVVFAIALNATLIIPVALRLATHPELVGIGTSTSGDIRSWVALVLCAVAGFWFVAEVKRKIGALPFFSLAFAIGALVSFDLASYGIATWLGFHSLLISCVLTGWSMLLVLALSKGRVILLSTEQTGRLKQFLAPSFDASAVRLCLLAGFLTVVLAMQAIVNDPTGYGWEIGALVLTGLLMAALNWLTLSRPLLFVAGFLFNMAASIWWVGVYAPRMDAGRYLLGFLYFNVIVLALPSVVWLLFELRARRSSSKKDDLSPSFHHIAPILSLILLSLAVFGGIMADLVGEHVANSATLSFLALISVAAAMFANLYDVRAKSAVAGLYALGLVGLGLVLDRMDLQSSRVLWTGMMLLAGYGVITSYAWRVRPEIVRIIARFRIPSRLNGESSFGWLGVLNALLSITVAVVAYYVVLSFDDFPLRLLAGVAVAAQVLTLGLIDDATRHELRRRSALAFISLGTVFCMWALLDPGSSGTWLNRAVLLMIATLLLIAADGLGSKRIFPDNEGWIQAARSIVPYLAGSGAVALLFVLGTEIDYQNRFGVVRINWLSLATVAVTLFSATVLFILFALYPQRDPLKLDEHGRMRYVYVAEGLLALLFMHMRLTMPWLFSGFFQQYWPLVVVGIAFIGVGISEALRRQGIGVLAAPIERTGALLPLLPVLGYWVANSRVDYSTVLFFVGLLYAGLSILRRSFAFGLIAAMAGNGALWHLFYHTPNLGFFQHPQIWLVPFALAVLIAAHLNRDRFSEDQMATVRYVALMVIYVSSTADIFLNGVAESPWLPLVLAGLSIAGVFLGISLRVRAFLYLGSMFLLIAVITMIWYASVNLGWTWLWYVAGILTGALIIFVFALFEKKRAEMLRVVGGLREWER